MANFQKAVEKRRAAKKPTASSLSEKETQESDPESIWQERAATAIVPVMFSIFQKQTSGMAFQSGKVDFARRSAANHMAQTLHAFIDGREKAYAVHDAIREIEALFGGSAALPLRQIRTLMDLDADRYEERYRLVTGALQMIDRQMREGAE